MNDLDIYEQSFEFVLKEQYEQALSLVMQRSIGKANDAVERMDMMFELGGIYYDNHYDDFALVIFEKLYEESLQTYGEEDSATVTYLLWQSACLKEIGTDEALIKAYNISKKVFKIRAKLYGIKHEDTVTALNWIGAYYFNSPVENYKKAVVTFKRVVELRKELYGQKHDYTLNSLAYYGQSLVKNGEYKAGLECLKKCYGMRCDLSGDTHETSLAIKNWIGTCLVYLKKYDEALVIFKTLKEIINENRVISSEDYKASEWIAKIESLLRYKTQTEILTKQEVINKLKKARDLDPNFNVFGVTGHRYQLNPCASPEEIEAFENKHHISLPEDYKYFLLHIGNGGAGPHYGILPMDKVYIEGELNQPVNYTESIFEDEWYDMVDDVYEKCDEDDEFDEMMYMYQGMMGISTQGCAYNTQLVITGEDRGKIIYTDDDFNTKPRFMPQKRFLEWYKKWLEFISNGYEIYGFHYWLSGDENTIMNQVLSENNKVNEQAFDSLNKFKKLSPKGCGFLYKLFHMVEDLDIKEAVIKLLNNSNDSRVNDLAVLLINTEKMGDIIKYINNVDENYHAICEGLKSNKNKDNIPQIIDVLTKSNCFSIKDIDMFLKHPDHKIRHWAFYYTNNNIQNKELLIPYAIYNMGSFEYCTNLAIDFLENYLEHKGVIDAFISLIKMICNENSMERYRKNRSSEYLACVEYGCFVSLEVALKKICDFNLVKDWETIVHNKYEIHGHQLILLK